MVTFLAGLCSYDADWELLMNIDDSEDLHIELHGNADSFRITKGKALFIFPWYRRILMRLIGRSHIFKNNFHYFIISNQKSLPSTPPDKP
jgi:hypothetical protein